MDVVRSRHSAVYAHILYGEECNGNGSCVVHYIPGISGPLSPGQTQYTWPGKRHNLQGQSPGLFVLPQSSKPIVQFFFPPRLYCYSLSSGALNHLVMKYNHNNLGLMATQNMNSIETL